MIVSDRYCSICGATDYEAYKKNRSRCKPCHKELSRSNYIKKKSLRHRVGSAAKARVNSCSICGATDYEAYKENPNRCKPCHKESCRSVYVKVKSRKPRVVSAPYKARDKPTVRRCAVELMSEEVKNEIKRLHKTETIKCIAKEMNISVHKIRTYINRLVSGQIE